MFRNGVAALHAASPPLPPGVRLCLLSSLPPPDAAALLSSFASSFRSSPPCALALLNSALAADPLCLIVDPGVAVASPLHLLYLLRAERGRSVACHPHVLVSLGAGSSAHVVEEIASVAPASGGAPPGVVLHNAVLRAAVGDDARLRHTRLAAHGVATSTAGAAAATASPVVASICTTLVAQAENSSYELVEATVVASGLARHALTVIQRGAATSTRVASFVLSGDGGDGETHTSVGLDHPDSSVAQLHKAIAASSSSRVVFDGAVRVGRAAQRTDAKQLTRSLLLARRARAHARPNLCIVADDVRCSHGATVAAIDDEALFYMLSRGVAEAEAKRALTWSFGAEVVGQMEHKLLRERAEAAARALLTSVGAL